MEKDFVDGKKQEAAILTANPLDEEGITTFREKYKPMSIQKKLSKKLNDLIDVLDKFNKAMPEKYGEQLDLKELLEKLYDKIEKSPVNETLKSLAADIGNLLFENINIDGLQFKEKVRLIEAVGRYIENPNTNDARVCRDWILSASIKFGVEDHDINQIIAKLPALLEAHKLEKKSDQRQEQKSDQRQEQLFTQAKTGEPGEIEKTEQSPVIKWYPE
jgi:hypothetical protein